MYGGPDSSSSHQCIVLFLFAVSILGWEAITCWGMIYVYWVTHGVEFVTVYLLRIVCSNHSLILKLGYLFYFISLVKSFKNSAWTLDLYQIYTWWLNYSYLLNTFCLMYITHVQLQYVFCRMLYLKMMVHPLQMHRGRRSVDVSVAD